MYEELFIIYSLRKVIEEKNNYYLYFLLKVYI